MAHGVLRARRDHALLRGGPAVPGDQAAHRYRRDLTDERTRDKQRTEKLPESAAIKLSSVVTDLHVTGRDIVNHLIAGERNPKTLAQLARTSARRKIAQL